MLHRASHLQRTLGWLKAKESFVRSLLRGQWVLPAEAQEEVLGPEQWPSPPGSGAEVSSSPSVSPAPRASRMSECKVQKPRSTSAAFPANVLEKRKGHLRSAESWEGPEKWVGRPLEPRPPTESPKASRSDPKAKARRPRAPNQDYKNKNVPNPKFHTRGPFSAKGLEAELGRD